MNKQSIKNIGEISNCQYRISNIFFASTKCENYFEGITPHHLFITCKIENMCQKCHRFMCKHCVSSENICLLCIQGISSPIIEICDKCKEIISKRVCCICNEIIAICDWLCENNQRFAGNMNILYHRMCK